ncbi:probable insulin-like peptide 4 [Drosophila gunungcola]|uniref:Insulin-like domain-containing protein n=1 Tax=Drosophila gunungcola TaxID=103775 RepID=A0A9P9YP71_9MUSC|nr:probable insulin-like peptide 4 [Drosophila gunungcola]KAI8040348.1 hypothetical protein M5D96_006288 [Drosophila gunungcola]
MSLIRLGLALLLLLAAVSQLLQPVQARRKMCGEVLIEALEMICVNGFIRRVRRSEGAKDKDRVRSLVRKLQQPEEEAETELDSESASASEPPASGSGRKLRRHRRRIAHECCKEGCTYDDIMEYCA